MWLSGRGDGLVLSYTDHKVVVHCQQGMERSVLAVAWWLHNHKNMLRDEICGLIRQKRPVALDGRERIGESHRQNRLPRTDEQEPG